MEAIGSENYVKNEVERLDLIFSTLSSKVKESVEELKEVSHRTEELNKAITQKVNVFSTILQANILFSKGGPLEEILQFLTERLKGIIGAGAAITLIKKYSGDNYDIFLHGINLSNARQLLESGEFANFLKIKERQIIDKKHKADSIIFLQNIINAKNIIVNPVSLRDRVIGFIIAGNRDDDFAFSDEDCQIIELFARNTGIIWEHQLLAKRVEDLEIKDPLTGIYNEKFFFVRLQEEINRASIYQRPCAFLVIEITNGMDYEHKFGMIELERILKKAVSIFKNNIRPIDILGRIQENKIGVILIERSKRQSHYIGTQLKEALSDSFKDSEKLPVRFSFAVAENPIDGTTPDQLFERIQSHLNEA